MKILYEPIPREIKDKNQLWRSKRDQWLEKVNKEEEYYYSDVEGTGTIFTQSQLEKIGKGSGIPVSNNWIHPIVNQKLAILTQTKPSIKVVPIDDRGKQYATVLDKAVKSVMYNSEAIGEEEETIKNMLVLGLGISHIAELDAYQIGRFGVQYEDLHPSLVILDRNAKKRSMKDQKGYFIEKEISLEVAKEKYQGIVNEINKRGLSDNEVTLEQFSVSTATLPTDRGKIDSYGFDKTIVVSEYYTKKLTNMYYIKNIDTNDIDFVFRENLDEDQDFILANAIDSEYNSFVKKTLMLGDYIVAEIMIPIREFALKVKYFEWGGEPYKSYGMIHFIKGMQETSDKAIHNMLINGMLTNNAGYLVPKGGILPEDKSKWETIGNKPGVMKEWNPVNLGGTILKPEREQIQQLSNFYPMIIDMMKSGMQFSTGINDIVSGDPSTRIDVFSSLQQYQNASMQRIQLAVQHINLANEHLGNVLIDFLMANLKPNLNYVFFDENNTFQELKIAEDMMENFKLARFLVLSISSEAMPTQRLAMGTELMKIAQTTSDPMDRSIFIEKAFELSDMRGYDEVREKIDMKNKMTQQIQQLQEEIERNEELMKQYENRALYAEYNAKKAIMLSELDKNVTSTDVKLKMELEVEKLKEQIKEMKKSEKSEKA